MYETLTKFSKPKLADYIKFKFLQKVDRSDEFSIVSDSYLKGTLVNDKILAKLDLRYKFYRKMYLGNKRALYERRDGQTRRVI